LLSITEANQFVSPPAAISTVMAGNATDISSCQYLSSPSSAPLILGFESFIPGTQMSTYAMQLAAKTLPGATLTVSHAVSGVGDQAWFVAGTFSGHGVSAHADALYVADGSVLIIVDNTNIDGMAPIGTTDNGAIQTEFVQIANLVVSRL
jgi:hypothetical protein